MRTKNIVVAIIILLFVGGGAFYGGAVYEKNHLSKQGLLRDTTTQLRTFRQGDRFQGAERFVARDRENSEFVSGEIISKDDKSITLKTRDGGSKIVYFSESTEIGKTIKGSSVDLENGKNVVISGKANQNGSFTAQNIQIR